MKNRIVKFLRCDEGAVTVDWVVLSAGVVAIAVAIFLSMQDGALELTDNVSGFLATQNPN